MTVNFRILNIKMYLRVSLVWCFEFACPTAANCSDTKESFYVQQITYLLTFINTVWKCYEISLHNKEKKVQQNTWLRWILGTNFSCLKSRNIINGRSKLNRILLPLLAKHIHPKFKRNDVNHFVIFIFWDLKEKSEK